ncbi:hypothetical protein [Nocardioides perillae]|uniref:Uncharacterized protein n=1 Tax=Nocardioides perillae TaxID=1119534 RepID=A0A7Y9RVY6_9ACTN|nr:hypothetical protein [Nocardioides perillae]NYG54965.1 hypothetical protein [Nocardioides perillae]
MTDRGPLGRHDENGGIAVAGNEAAERVELQVIADDDGVAVLGPPAEVERFLVAEGLVDARPLELSRLHGAASVGGAVAQAGSSIAADSGRWVKLTKESAKAIERHGLRQSSKSGLTTGVIRGPKGQVKGFVEFARGPGASLTNPAVLAGAAGIMSQLAMQQAMDEITDYLQRIDAKLDDVLQAQKDSVVARLVGSGFVIDEAVTVRNRRGRVDEVTWSKVQAVPSTIAEVQGYALAQLDALAQKLEGARRVGTIADVVQEAEGKTQEWLAVLARTFQLQDGIAVLELDRVLDAAPEELDAHRTGLREARQDRLHLIEQATRRLLDRISEAATVANQKVLRHPSASPTAVGAGEKVTRKIEDFYELLGLSGERREMEVRRWTTAAGEVRDRALEQGVDTAQAVRRRGGAVAGTARDGARDARVRLGARLKLVRGAGPDEVDDPDE